MKRQYLKGKVMAGTFSKIYYHIIFSTRGRAPFLQKNIKSEVNNYICGIVKSEEGFVYAIGGTADHVHLLCSLPSKKSISEMLQRIKGHSSKWINENTACDQKFNWQNGYGIFTVSHSQVDSVKKYILNQESHHKKISFKDEFRILLEKHDVDFKEEHIWR